MIHHLRTEFMSKILQTRRDNPPLPVFGVIVLVVFYTSNNLKSYDLRLFVVSVDTRRGISEVVPKTHHQVIPPPRTLFVPF